MSLTIGQAAPDFEIANQHGEKVSLSSFKGAKKCLVDVLSLLIYWNLHRRAVCHTR